MKKSILAILLCLTMTLTAIPVFAGETEILNVDAGMVNSEIIDGIETVVIKIDENHFDGFGVAENHSYREGDDIFLDGELLISMTSVEYPVSPMMLTRTDKPALGSASDYTVFQGTERRDLTFARNMVDVGFVAFSIATKMYFGTALTVAELVFGMLVSKAPQTRLVNLDESTYGHKDIPGLYHKYEQEWYVDDTYSECIYESTVYDYWN